MSQYSLGRRVQHDPQSRRFAHKAAPGTPLVSVQHTRHIPVLDQGNIGSCTGNAAVGALGTEPYFTGRQWTEDDAVDVYSAATVIDGFPGTFRPDDTGSSGLAVAKVLTSRGLISGYRHAFNITDALAALQVGPVITGVPWYESFFEPAPGGLISIKEGDREAGGHEFVVDGYDALAGLVWSTNSWGTDWSVGGRFCMTVATWAQLLSQQGDVTVFVPLTQPAPVPTPVPGLDPADQTLVAGLDPWATGITSRYTKAGKAVAAYRAWRQAKGL